MSVVATSIKDLREKKGVSQQVLADDVKVTVATVSRWESGEFLPSADKLVSISKSLDCKIEDLLKEE